MNKFWVLTNLIQNSNVYPIPKVEHPHHQQSDQQQHPQQQQSHQQPPPSHQPPSSTTSSKGGGSRHPANHAIGPAAPGIYHNPVPGPPAPGASSAPTVPTSAIGSTHLTNLSGPAAAATHSGRGSAGHAAVPPGAHLQLNGTVTSDHTKPQYLGNMQVHPAHAGSGHHAPPTAAQGPPQSAHPPQPIPIVKPEFKVPSIPTHLMDVRGPDGSIVKINMPEHHDPSKPPNNVEMLKVNIEDLSQFLSYHEVFGKLPSDMLTGPSASLVPSSATNTASTSGGHSNGKLNHARGGSSQQHPQGESPFKCNYCAKSFTRKEHLTNHVRQHTGESPYRCPYCGKTFTRKEHLTNHVRKQKRVVLATSTHTKRTDNNARPMRTPASFGSAIASRCDRESHVPAGSGLRAPNHQK